MEMSNQLIDKKIIRFLPFFFIFNNKILSLRLNLNRLKKGTH